MAEKSFFGATKSEIKRFKNEVNRDIYGKSSGKKKKSRKRK